MKILLLIIFSVCSVVCSVVIADAKSIRLDTVVQNEIRPSIPFPDFLSTGPLVQYDYVQKKPIKGHTYRISTFSNNQRYRIYIEKVEFGAQGCCREIVKYRQLILTEDILKSNFSQKNGKHGFKLIRWVKAEVFDFEAYGGKYRLSELGSEKPLITELNSN